MQINDLPEILTSREAADLLRLTEEELIAAVESKEIIGFKLAGKWRITRENIVKILNLTPIQKENISQTRIGNPQKREFETEGEVVGKIEVSPALENFDKKIPEDSTVDNSLLKINEDKSIGVTKMQGTVFSFHTITKVVKVKSNDERVFEILPENFVDFKVLPNLDDVVEFEWLRDEQGARIQGARIVSSPRKKLIGTSGILDKNLFANTNTQPEDGEAVSMLKSVKQSSADLFLKGKKEFTAGNLQTAMDYLERAYKQGEKNPQIYLVLAQTLQRLTEYDKAQQYLDIGIRNVKSTEKLPLINAKAQIFSSQGLLQKAADTYEQLLKLEKRPTARRYTNVQLVRLYRSLHEIDKAKSAVTQLLQENPQDQVAIRLMAALERPVNTSLPEAALVDDEVVSELVVDLPEIDLISPMLKQDLAVTEYRDEKILRQGGIPSVDDADRLLQGAEKEKGTEFGERYPLFLEAAKAYSELPEGSYTLENFYRALARYAMLKGGALVSEFRRRVNTGNANLEALSHLRDSATSYYLESLAIQMNLDERFALIALANYLRAQIVYILIRRREIVPGDIFEQSFSDLFGFCLGHKDQEITTIAYNAVIAWGAAGGDIWNRLQSLPGGGGVVSGTLFRKNTRIRPYKVLSEISGQIFKVDQRPSEVLRTLFLGRRRQQQEIQFFFSQLQQMPLDIRNSRELQEQWKNLPLHKGALLDTDFEIHEGISSILATLLPYQTRSPEERAAILFTVRTSVEHLLDFIEANPTYWGRVGFEPLLTKWQSAIRNAEQRRIGELQPKFVMHLEPPVFHLEGELVTGGVNLHNVGRATAEGVVINVKLQDAAGGNTLLEFEARVNDEIAVDKTHNFALRLPVSRFSLGTKVPYRLWVKVSPVFRQIRLDPSEEEFTLQIHSGSTFELSEIPWNELKIPPKHLFKGREKLIHRLLGHISSTERNKTYILFGLTRTGKSSILNYLSQQIDLREERINNQKIRFLSFTWDLGWAKGHTKASDMWGYLLGEQVVSKIDTLVQNGFLDFSPSAFSSATNYRFKDWESILVHLQKNRIYPVFLIDEFSYYRELVDSKRIDASFLAAIRTFAIGGHASFVIAGTYDLQNLIKDPSYGITGQFVNAIETQVSRIELDPAIELVQVMEPQLRFTSDAINHILLLSYRIPYFIQIICKNCAVYAYNTGRNIIGFPEVESVVKVLVTGESDDPHLKDVQRIPPGQFMNNMYNPSDPSEFGALISTIASLTLNQLTPRKVTYSEIQETWDRHGVRFFQARLAKATQELCNREILNASDDDGMPAYQISVDLFRRWWAHEHRHLTLELDALKQEN